MHDGLLDPAHRMWGQGGKEAERSNTILHRIIVDAISGAKPALDPRLIHLVTTRGHVDELLKLDGVVDLVSPVPLDMNLHLHVLAWTGPSVLHA